MTNVQQSKFEALFEGLKLQLKTEGRYFSNLSDHEGEKGRLNESHLKRVLRQHLPDKYGIGTGFIVSSKSIYDTKNPQLDLIIFDRLNNAPLYQSEAFGIYSVEMVYAYIEVKTLLTRSEIGSAFKINAGIRSLASDKEYEDAGGNKLAPRFYIFAYRSSTQDNNTIERQVREQFLAQGDAHVHGLYVLENDLLLARKALGDAKAVDLSRADGPLTFAVFITNLVSHCEMMISSQEISNLGTLPRPITLPRAKMGNYFGDLS